MLIVPINAKEIRLIPKNFNSDGLLDPGTYIATFDEVRNSILVIGNNYSLTWDAAWRSHLINQAEILVTQLWDVGIDDVFLDGSFVENKDHPNDIDGYFDPHLSMYDPVDMKKFEELISKLNNLDPHKIWDWDRYSRRSVPGFHKKQLPMWIAYRVELYPHLNAGITGIKDANGNDLKFPAAFRQSRNEFKQKGIIKVIR